MFGGIDLNLRKAGIRAESATIDIAGLWRQLKVPANWVGSRRPSSAFSDKSAQPAPDMPESNGSFQWAKPFGGVDIKN